MDNQDNYVAQTNTENQVPSTPVATPVQTPPKKNKSGGAGAIIAILIIVIIALGGTVAFLLINQNNNPSKNSNTTSQKTDDKDPQTTPQEEAEISSTTIKNDILTKMNNILKPLPAGMYGNKSAQSSYMMAWNYEGTSNLFSGKELTQNNKLYIAISSSTGAPASTYKDFDGLFKDEMQIRNISDNEKASYLEDFGGHFYYNESDVANTYKNYFGESLTTHKSVSDLCPKLTYHKDFHVYTDFDRCGDGGDGSIVILVDKITKKENNAYAYLYAGYLSVNEELHSEAARDSKVVKTVTDYHEQLITNENKTNFAQYRFIFEGENDDYHFVKVEKVEKK